jgi:hypothetical protein
MNSTGRLAEWFAPPYEEMSSADDKIASANLDWDRPNSAVGSLVLSSETLAERLEEACRVDRHEE